MLLSTHYVIVLKNHTTNIDDVLIYEQSQTGIVPSPTPVLQINMEDISEMCWEPRPRERTKIETEDENV